MHVSSDKKILIRLNDLLLLSRTGPFNARTKIVISVISSITVSGGSLQIAVQKQLGGK